MPPSVKRFEVLEQFACLGAQCPDTCCQGWQMPVDARQWEKYVEQAPELIARVDRDQGSMRLCDNGSCASLKEGMCSIHADYGDAFLSDACYYYPRLMHKLGDRYLMTGAISCPEMLRLMLVHPNPFTFKEVALDRMPHQRHALATRESADAVEAALMEALAIAGDGTVSPETAVERLLARVLGSEDHTVETKTSDAHAIYYALALTEAFGKAGVSAQLPQIMQTMERELDCRFDRETRRIQLGPTASQRYAMLKARWQMDAASALAPTLCRWLQAQVALTCFPYGGFADASVAERGAVLVQRFATIKLALMCHVSEQGVPPDEAVVLRVIQGIARFQDHIADMKLTRMIHRDSGWDTPARLRGLVHL